MKPLKGSVGKVAASTGVKPKSPVKPITGSTAGGVRSVPAKPIMTPTRPAMPGRAASTPTRLTSKPSMLGRAAAAPKAIAKAQQMKKK